VKIGIPNPYVSQRSLKNFNLFPWAALEVREKFAIVVKLMLIKISK
jgi:hypothetical protein